MRARYPNSLPIQKSPTFVRHRSDENPTDFLRNVRLFLCYTGYAAGLHPLLGCSRKMNRLHKAVTASWGVAAFCCLLADGGCERRFLETRLHFHQVIGSLGKANGIEQAERRRRCSFSSQCLIATAVFCILFAFSRAERSALCPCSGGKAQFPATRDL